MQRLYPAVLAALSAVSCGGKATKNDDRPAPRVERAADAEAALPPKRHAYLSLADWCNAAELEQDERATIDALRSATLTTGQSCAAFVEAAARATTLDLSGKGLKTLAPLASLTQLKTLVAYGNPIEDLAPLSRLARLNGLHTDDGTYGSLAPLANLMELETVALAHAPVSDLSPLGGLPRLRQLWAYKMPIADLAPLSHAEKLQNLYLWDDRIESLEPVANLPGLTDLALSGNLITNLAPLAGLTKLKNLDVSYQRGAQQLMSLAALGNLPAGALANVDEKKLFSGNAIARSRTACPLDAGPEALRKLCRDYLSVRRARF